MSVTISANENLRFSNIFDPIEETLDQRVFKGNTPRASVVRFIDKLYSKQFERAFGNLDAHEYISLYLTGSLTTYQYSDDSDCDISVFPNYSMWDQDPTEIRKQLITMSIDKIDGTFLPGSRHPLQFFVVPPDVDPSDLYKPGLRSAWSFESKSWIVPPEKDRAHNVQVELPETFKRCADMADKMTQALDADPEVARDMWHQIHKKRQQEQRAGLGDFSQGNLVYKWLLHEGLFDRIKDELHEYIAHYAAVQTELRPHAPLQEVARGYMQNAGLPYNPPTDYAVVDPSRAARIAQAYEEMEHNPNDPAVKASYDAMINETKAQYDHLVRNGYTFEFYPYDHDPYPDSPHQAVRDIYDNKHLYVYPTAAGFGTLNTETDHPLLEDSGVRWNGLAVTHNDLFRGVHDVFGHAKEGVGFRANGEENAWRQHSAMYSDEARPAMTAETRGQNSWVNFGPHGEANQTADQANTVYADQKAGLLPDWAMHDGLQTSSKVVELDTITDPTHAGRRPWIYYEGNTYVGSEGSSHAGLFTAMIENMGADPEELWGRWNNDESGVCGLIDTDNNKVITYGVNPPDRVMADLHSLGLPIYYDSLHLGAEDLMDRVTMKVIYDFEKDRIYLGTQADQKAMPGTTILGDYDDKTSTVTLYHGDGNWLNPNYFHRLWYHSFPNRALHNVRIQSGDDPAVSVQTRNPFSVPKTSATDVAYHEAFIYLGAPYNQLLLGGSEHYDLIREFVEEQLRPLVERGDFQLKEPSDDWFASDFDEEKYEAAADKIRDRLLNTKMVYGHIGFYWTPDRTKHFVYTIYSDFIGGEVAQGLMGQALKALRTAYPDIEPSPADANKWWTGGW